jgi:hypothetical protein
MLVDQPGLPQPAVTLTEQFKGGLAAPICLTWELTYACNLQCVHCLSASGRRDPRELSTAECLRVVDELERMQVFYANVGGGEPTLRPDFWDLLDYSVAHHVGIKFSTNGVRLDSRAAQRLARTGYVDVQISIDGATADVNDAVRGTGCMAAKFFTGLPLDGPDPECVLGHGERELAKVCLPDRPQAAPGHSRRQPGRSAPVFVPVDLIATRAAT